MTLPSLATTTRPASKGYLAAFDDLEQMFGILAGIRVAPRSVTCRGRGRHPLGGVDVANRTCSVDECERAAHARGWCGMHYKRWVSTGSPTGMRIRATCTICDRKHFGRGLCRLHYDRQRRTGSFEASVIVGDDLARFWSKIDKGGPGGCWLWQGGKSRFGHGVFALRDKNVSAHRYSYELLVGPIPGDREIDHVCRVRNCVNPDHLEPVTHKVNMERGAHALKTECPQGHPYDKANTYLYRGRRSCRTCHRERSLAYVHRKRGEAA